MVDWNKPLRTRCGQTARLIGSGLYGREDHYIVAITGTDGVESVSTFHPDGTYWSSSAKSALDLMNTAERIQRTVWLNVYPAPYPGSYYNTREEARRCRSSQCLATIPIEIDCEIGEDNG